MKELVAVSICYGLVAALFVILLTGCSIKAEFGWHGETGKDDRTASQLKQK